MHAGGIAIRRTGMDRNYRESDFINPEPSDSSRRKKRWILAVAAVISIGSVLVFTGFAAYPENHPPEEYSDPASGDLPIFDTHVHYKEPAWSLYSPEEVIELFRKSGVTSALVSSSPDDGTRMLYAENPDIVVPFLRPYHGTVTSSNWYRQDTILNYLKDRLETHVYKGIGEFHIHNPHDADSEVIQATMKMALRDDMYIHVHTTHEGVEKLFELEPEIKILWAHAGMSDPPEVVAEMFDRYEHLWVDISIRELEIAPNGLLDAGWEALFLRHPDRITIGSDTWVNSRWEQYESILSFDRSWLAQLPEDVARKIAYENAERLFR